ncbi:MAG: long-chain-fatty-acid--CoA ligase [Deltaproteobacteria bacterium]|nr:long-chain-fatty-acid--CoA ligase [Deltaproteobacteria bacterium]
MNLNVGYILLRNVHELPDKLAVIFEGKRYTYKAFNERVNRLANALLRKGVVKGDKVAYLLHNCSEFAEISFALSKIGALSVPINFRLKEEEIGYIIENSDASLLFFGPEFQEAVSKLLPRLNKVKKAIQVGETPEYEDLLDSSSPQEPAVLVLEEDEHSIMYTSGTTGSPKGAVHTHKSRIWNSLNMLVDTGLRGTDVFAITTPLFHIAAGHTMLLSTIFIGGTVVILRAFSLPEFFQVIQKEEVTAFFAVPTMFARILEHPQRNDYDLSSLRLLFTGGAVISVELKEQLMKAFPQATLDDLMGLTEGGPLTTFLPHREAFRKPESVGRAHFSQMVRVVNEKGEDVQGEEVGEIIVQGPAVMKEYYKNPEATAKALRNGWLYTGDLARVDEEGYQYLIVRRTDLIISGGENIYPAEVERVLLLHPGVKEAAAIGVKDKEWGERVTAVVVPKERQRLTEEEILSFCKERMAGFKCPRSVIFIDELPKNQLGKILYKELRNRFDFA